MSATVTDVEVWLTGDPASVTRAIQALSADARITLLGDEHPLVGADTGRVRRYLRLSKDISSPRRAGRAPGGVLPIDAKETH